MNDKPKQPQLEADVDDELLLQYNLLDLPVVFSMRDGNQIIQEKAPCYSCSADGFYGQGKSGTWYEEGSIIVMDTCPNYHTEPLNRAAALRYVKWVSSLPQQGADIGVEDMAEAAHTLAKNPRIMELDPVSYQKAVVDLAVKLKIRRLGKDAMNLPGFNHNFAPQSGGNAAPILNAKLAEMGQQGPGSLHRDRGGQAGGVRRAAAPATVSAGNALGGPAPS